MLAEVAVRVILPLRLRMIQKKCQAVLAKFCIWFLLWTCFEILLWFLTNYSFGEFYTFIMYYSFGEILLWFLLWTCFEIFCFAKKCVFNLYKKHTFCDFLLGKKCFAWLISFLLARLRTVCRRRPLLQLTPP